MFAFGSITINLLSIALLAYAGVLAVINYSFKKKYSCVLITNCVLEIFKLQGYFIAFGTTEVSYEDFWMVVLLLFSMPMLLQRKYDFKLLILCLLMVFSALAGIIMEFIWPFQGDIIAYDTKGAWDGYILGTTVQVSFRFSVSRFILYFVRILMYAVTAYILKTQSDMSGLKKIINSLSKILSIYIWYGLFEFVTKTFFHSGIIFTINRLLLGLGTSTYSVIKYRGNIPMLQCFTREPSHYTQSLLFIAVILLLNKKIQDKFKIKNMIDILAIIFIMLVSRSFAGILYIAIIFVLFMILRKKTGKNILSSIKRVRVLIIAGGLAVAAVIIFVTISPDSYIGDRLLNSIESLKRIIAGNWQSYRLSSEMVRMVSIYETFMDFLTRPLFGLGLAVEISHGGLVNMLADVGIIGAVVWYKLSFYKIKKRSYDKFMLIMFFIMANLMAGTSTMIFSSMMLIIIETTSCYVLREKSEVYRIYESIAH